jgi:GNAT superfamily N-acetyltransferase
VTSLSSVIASLEPRLHDGVYCFVSEPDGADLQRLRPVAMMSEPEGVTLVLHEQDATDARLEIRFRASWITLDVQSDLEMAGLTAAVSRVLADEGIACNVMAGAHHDHLFVPVEQGLQAMSVLRALQRRVAPSVSRGDYTISSDSGTVDVTAVHAFLTQSYWAEGISRTLVARAVRGSLCFSVLQGAEQVGFARVVTDRATYGYLCDVYVLEAHRGHGLARWLMETVMAHPDLQGLRRFGLVTRDAHRLYEGVGFTTVLRPELHMEIARPGLYLVAAKSG